MHEARNASRRRPAKVLVGVFVVGIVAAASLAATATGRTADKTISVAIVANPQMQDIASLTPSLFTAKTGIKVKYTILDEGKLREITTRDVGAGGKSFDAVMIGMYEAPQFGAAGLLQNLTPQAKADKAYAYNDLIPAVRNGLSANGNLYASPFYAESSFVMYRKDVLAAKHLTMPARPTWQQVATIARKVNSPSMAGICLRGKPGWGDLGAAFTTVLNTFGGTWWSSTADGKPAAALAATATGGTAAKTISVAIVANPQMQDIASLTPSLFTAKTGIKVKYTILDEGKLREVTTRDVGAGGKSFDAVMIGMYEAPQFGAAGLLQNLSPQAQADKAYAYSDLIPAVRNGLSAKGNLYASPFYAESSFVMYRKDVLAAKGLTMPARPTWQQVATIARKINSPSMAGICLRG
jgi:ABC-type glycerol-3-phosphate transport system substrate-binding protein